MTLNPQQTKNPTRRTVGEAFDAWLMQVSSQTNGPSDSIRSRITFWKSFDRDCHQELGVLQLKCNVLHVTANALRFMIYGLGASC